MAMLEPFETPEQREARAAEQRAAQERDLEQLKNDVEALMATGAGRRIVWRLLEASHVYQTCYRDNPLQMARAEGRREIGLMLTEWLSIYAWENYQLMLTEANNERRERDARQRANRSGGNTAD
nr:MAG TPA: hypothetical protein [Caudoviricetes sp.]